MAPSGSEHPRNARPSQDYPAENEVARSPGGERGAEEDEGGLCKDMWTRERPAVPPAAVQKSCVFQPWQF